MDIHRQEAKLRWFHVPPPTLKIIEEIMGLASARIVLPSTANSWAESPLGGETGSAPRVTLFNTEEQLVS